MTEKLLGDNYTLLRKESFGGTLFFVKTGRRAYVSRDEFDRIKSCHSLPEALTTELETETKRTVVTEPNWLYDNNFSSPDTVFLEVTRACNLDCAHCFNRSGRALSNQLTLSQIGEVIDNLAASGVQEIRFTGGEPLTLHGIESLIHKVSSRGLRSSIGTNATLITEHKADELKKAGLHMGIVSLDGLEKRHDRIRGRSSFQMAMAGIERLIARSIDIRVNTVVMRSNLQDLEPLLKTLTGRGIPVFLRRFILSGRGDSSEGEMLTAVEYENLHNRLRPLIESSQPLVNGHHINSGRNVAHRIPLPFIRRDCSAGQRGLVILPDGKVQTCGFLGSLGETSVGTMPTESLCDIWSRLNDSDYIGRLETNLTDYNNSTSGPRTNCLAVALAGQEPLVRLKQSAKKVMP